MAGESFLLFALRLLLRPPTLAYVFIVVAALICDARSRPFRGSYGCSLAMLARLICLLLVS